MTDQEILKTYEAAVQGVLHETRDHVQALSEDVHAQHAEKRTAQDDDKIAQIRHALGL